MIEIDNMSILLKSDAIPVTITLEEEVTGEIDTERINMNNLHSCNQCNFDTESVQELQNHIREGSHVHVSDDVLMFQWGQCSRCGSP